MIVRIGIDVGGTFTDVVAVDAATREIVARVKVPTTHRAQSGVAGGIVAGVERLLALPELAAATVAFVAHSTTQATNALLEGDVARVGIVALDGGRNPFARRHMRLAPIPLTDRIALVAPVAYARAGSEASVDDALDELARAGIDVVAATSPFGVDDPERERSAVAAARSRGLLATSGADVSSLYGLRARTRTAVLNAAILPTMVRTARETAGAIARSGIDVPLMIMRSDGGVMDVREMERVPIATMLSGPAAGIAGALLHENVTDGIFIEVGGTSADCSVIRHGRPQMRAARIGGHRTMVRTLDVRTVGVAGGSLVHVAHGERGAAVVRAVGPRSAHIAGYAYASFAGVDLDGARVVAPQSVDGHLILETRGGTRVAPTPSCAATLLGYAGSGDFAYGDVPAAEAAFAIAGDAFGCDARTLARAVLERAAAALVPTIVDLIDEYDLDRRTLELVGGGGGAAALVPFIAEQLGVAHRIARDAEVISPVGVALALVRDVVERTIAAPTPDDVVRVRREAIDRAVAAGADAATVETTVEIDARRSLVRVTASGATPAVAGVGASRTALAATDLEAVARRAAHAAASAAVERVAETNGLVAFIVSESAAPRRRGFGSRAPHSTACVLDRGGRVKLVLAGGRVVATTVAHLESAMRDVLESETAFGDVGRALPEISLGYGSRVADLGSVTDAHQAVALALEEIRGAPEHEPAMLVCARRRA